MPFWSFVISIAALIVVVITLADLFGRRHLGAKAVWWALLIIVLPFIGAVIYWYVRPASAEDVQRAAQAQADLRREPINYGPGGGQNPF